MKIENVHERALPADGATPGVLIDGLASAEDRLWPHDRWPPMHLQGGLREGSLGGHGPISYRVIEYQPARLVRFRFSGPAGLIGGHRYELEESGESVVLRHVLEGRTEGRMHWQWPLLFRPFHDALIEDSLDRASAAVSKTPYEAARWGWWVRGLRWALKGLI